MFVIDLFGYQKAEAVRDAAPAIFQHLLEKVKPQRDLNNRPTRRDNWWLFGENQPKMRAALRELSRFVATADTAKHRIFQFLPKDIICDDKIVVIASPDAFVLGTLSARIHGAWADGARVRLGVGNDPVYASTRCFDPFPFPAADDLQKQRIRAIAEDLDAHRKRVLADHPHLTLTGLYNVLEKLRAGTAPDALDPADRRIFDDGLVLILKEYHDRLDAAVAAAYGWPADLSDNDILARLVALNQERVQEEAAGHVRWLRPDYQIPRFGTEKDRLDLRGGAIHAAEAATAAGPKPSFPAGELDQAAAVMKALGTATAPLTPTALAAQFRQGRRILPQVEAALAAMVRVGGLVFSPDCGRTFLPRRAA